MQTLILLHVTQNSFIQDKFEIDYKIIILHRFTDIMVLELINKSFEVCKKI